MIDLAELAGALDQAMDEHQQAFGSGKEAVGQKARVVKILLWSYRKELVRGLKLASQIAQKV